VIAATAVLAGSLAFVGPAFAAHRVGKRLAVNTVEFAVASNADTSASKALRGVDCTRVGNGQSCAFAAGRSTGKTYKGRLLITWADWQHGIVRYDGRVATYIGGRKQFAERWADEVFASCDAQGPCA
jgi:hypothetical protein